MSAIRQLPAAVAIGFQMETPTEVKVVHEPGSVRCSEQRDGKTVGELELAVFKAALLIDRDGILEEKVASVAEDNAERGDRVLAPVAVSLPGASGFRADIEKRATSALPYVYVFAIAPHDLGVDGGVLVTVRCAAPEWKAADAMMKSLRLLTRGGRAKSANDADEAPPEMPMIGKRED